MFELRGAVDTFAAAVRRVSGLELVDEEELEADDTDKAPVAYLMVPDIRALREIESLWRRWLEDKLPHGFKAWRDVFTLLRDLRPWGPSDRVQRPDLNFLEAELLTRRWSGEKAPDVRANGVIALTVQRDPDQGALVDESIPFGLAITLTMPGVVGLYDEVRDRIGLRQKAPA